MMRLIWPRQLARLIEAPELRATLGALGVNA
jgi:hypothetical protein